ncbi:uncharacterized protein LOC113353227 [Papaver somniferum]|uniref:uncharacterized protein LOC113353227 n=1 Tax=Papaver somniferum TaxID=3469 RepID=UPI000E704022|nr:uncharacterized protein LOC113353227 [Papaver somniferum]
MTQSERGASNCVGSSKRSHPSQSLSVASELPSASQVQQSGIQSTPAAVATEEAVEEIEVDEDPIIAEAKKKLRAVRSDVWDDFERLTEKKMVKGKEIGILVAKCKHCNKRMTSPSSQGTSKLHYHAKTCQKKPANKKGQTKITTVRTEVED